jgi:hypothetical protein
MLSVHPTLVPDNTPMDSTFQCIQVLMDDAVWDICWNDVQEVPIVLGHDNQQFSIAMNKSLSQTSVRDALYAIGYDPSQQVAYWLLANGEISDTEVDAEFLSRHLSEENILAQIAIVSRGVMDVEIDIDDDSDVAP